MRDLRRTRTTVLGLTVAAALSLSLSACSDDDKSDSTSESSSGDSSSSSASADQSATISVTHTMGTTEIPRNPGKILSLSPSFTDAFSALGRPVDVELRADFSSDEFPWENHDSGQVVKYPMTNPDIEKVADADPDVIFAGYVTDQATYDKLNAIAPTVGTVGGSPMSDDWRESTTIAGEVIGKSAEAKELVSAAEKAFEDTRNQYPALKGATGAFGQASERGVAVVTGDKDPANVFLSDLGIVIPDNIKKASQDGSRAFISAENSDLLNTDMLIMWPLGMTEQDLPAKIKGWDGLTAVKNHAVLIADNTSAGALNPPTILSVSWALKTLEPTFKALNDAAK